MSAHSWPIVIEVMAVRFRIWINSSIQPILPVAGGQRFCVPVDCVITPFIIYFRAFPITTWESRTDDWLLNCLQNRPTMKRCIQVSRQCCGSFCRMCVRIRGCLGTTIIIRHCTGLNEGLIDPVVGCIDGLPMRLTRRLCSPRLRFGTQSVHFFPRPSSQDFQSARYFGV